MPAAIATYNTAKQVTWSSVQAAVNGFRVFDRVPAFVLNRGNGLYINASELSVSRS